PVSYENIGPATAGPPRCAECVHVPPFTRCGLISNWGCETVWALDLIGPAARSAEHETAAHRHVSRRSRSRLARVLAAHGGAHGTDAYDSGRCPGARDRRLRGDAARTYHASAWRRRQGEMGRQVVLRESRHGRRRRRDRVAAVRG